jgi:hypothetical protein
VQLAKATAEVEVPLRQRSRGVAPVGAERQRGDAVPGRAGRAAGPAADVGLRERIGVSAPGGGRGEIAKALVVQPAVDEGQRGALGNRVVLQPGDQPGRQGVRGKRATVGVPVRHRLKEPPVPLTRLHRLARPDPGQQA